MDQNANHENEGKEPQSRLPATQPAQPPRALALLSQQEISPLLARDEAASDDEGIDFRAYWHNILKRKWMVLGLVLLAGAWSTVDTLLTTKIYRASTSVQIATNQVQVMNMGEVEGGVGGYSDRSYYDTQFELIRSRALAQRVVADMGLAESGQLESLTPESGWASVLAMITGEAPSLEDPKAAAEVVELSAQEKLESERGLAGWFASGISVQQVGSSELARLNYDSPDPQFSVRAANAVAEAYVASNLERRFDSSAYAKTYLEDRLKELKVKLEDSEQQLVEFAQQEQIVGIGADLTAGTLTEQDLVNANSSLSAARTERLKSETRWRQAQASTGAVVAGMIGENSMVQTLQERRAELQSEYQNRLARFKPAYPQMQELKGQIDELDRQVTSEIEAIKIAIRAEYEAALAQEQTLVSMLAGLKTEVLDLQSRSIRYNILKREVDTNRQLYDSLLQRYKEIGVAAGVSANNLSIIDRAESAYQVAPNLRRNVLMGLIFGLAIGVLLALLLEYLDDTIKSPADIENKLRLVHLGMVPKLSKEQTPDTAGSDLRSAFSEAYRSIRTALQFSTDHGIPSLLVVTSTSAGEGKTTTAIALARNFAQLGKRVLLIDADLRNPSVHKLFGIENTTGLSNCLAGAAKPGECIRDVGQDGLSVITCGPVPPNPAELLAGPRMLSLSVQAIERFDHVIIDAPPVVGLADALILGNLAKGTVLVIEAGRARVGAVQTSVKRLASARTRLLGAVLTKFDARHASYGYGYGHSGYGQLSYEYFAYGDAPKKSLARRK